MSSPLRHHFVLSVTPSPLPAHASASFSNLVSVSRAETTADVSGAGAVAATPQVVNIFRVYIENGGFLEGCFSFYGKYNKENSHLFLDAICIKKCPGKIVKKNTGSCRLRSHFLAPLRTLTFCDIYFYSFRVGIMAGGPRPAALNVLLLLLLVVVGG